MIEHCKASIARWKPNTVEERDEMCVFHFVDDTPDVQIIKGNGLNILNTKGEGVVGFDRIYVGAAVSKANLATITKLLSPGGILVGPGKFRITSIEFTLHHLCLYDLIALHFFN